jgi:hypothetical protein
VSWAGFRFVGVPDRRPQKPWTDEHRWLIDERAQAEIKRLIAANATAGAAGACGRDREGDE